MPVNVAAACILPMQSALEILASPRLTEVAPGDNGSAGVGPLLAVAFDHLDTSGAVRVFMCD